MTTTAATFLRKRRFRAAETKVVVDSVNVIVPGARVLLREHVVHARVQQAGADAVQEQRAVGGGYPQVVPRPQLQQGQAHVPRPDEEVRRVAAERRGR